MNLSSFASARAAGAKPAPSTPSDTAIATTIRVPDDTYRGPGLPIFTPLIIAHIAIVANAMESDQQLNMCVFNASEGMNSPTWSTRARGR
ncbi:hypothetical protein MmonteBS_14490 [Mycobacterium montefiorense]|uniref:Uncharacterized protein n=1 Tax=Mycobacterium montefiorense TaxID=154654 RepID=A0AA37UVE0_9MYCO|nr:hypothetical protein MmonteBS_14490 [Mycobacterium montefiorense]GKU36822.1 hypothetical protein NJB14191_41680 [Mycobacterium montefiorense]GKU42941.1 hypothetical protein NJB14192_49240 [Mycobacterium montefiorense]GKU48381.1 hypothetical protein NJB14194_49960 [Mycobacterium montefiorense]GKU50882.1 hypothetical protein NJB14195_21280 [Mycobacterium montefiorense]